MDARSMLKALGPNGLEKMRKVLEKRKQALYKKQDELEELKQLHMQKEVEYSNLRQEGEMLKFDLKFERKRRLEFLRRIADKKRKLAELRSFDPNSSKAELEAKRRKDQELKKEVEKVLKDKEDAIREEEENRRRNDALLEPQKKKFEELKRDIHKMVVAVNIVRFRKMQIENGGGFINKQKK